MLLYSYYIYLPDLDVASDFLRGHFSSNVRADNAHALHLAVVLKHAGILHHLAVLCDRGKFSWRFALIKLVRRMADPCRVSHRLQQISRLIKGIVHKTLLLEVVEGKRALVQFFFFVC